MTTDIVIVAAARTAVGKFGGTLAKTPASELGATVLKALLERARLTGDQVGEVILGQVLHGFSGAAAQRRDGRVIQIRQLFRYRELLAILLPKDLRRH